MNQEKREEQRLEQLFFDLFHQETLSEEEINNKKYELEQKEHDLTTIKSLIELSQTHFEIAKASLKKILEQSKIEYQTYQKEIEKLLQEIAKLKKRQNRYQENISRLNQKRGELYKEKIYNSIIRSEWKKNSLRQELNQVEYQHKKLHRQQHKLLMQQDQVKERIAYLEKECQRLQNLLNQYNTLERSNFRIDLREVTSNLSFLNFQKKLLLSSPEIVKRELEEAIRNEELSEEEIQKLSSIIHSSAIYHLDEKIDTTENESSVGWVKVSHSIVPSWREIKGKVDRMIEGFCNGVKNRKKTSDETKEEMEQEPDIGWVKVSHPIIPSWSEIKRETSKKKKTIDKKIKRFLRGIEKSFTSAKRKLQTSGKTSTDKSKNELLKSPEIKNIDLQNVVYNRMEYEDEMEQEPDIRWVKVSHSMIPSRDEIKRQARKMKRKVNKKRKEILEEAEKCFVSTKQKIQKIGNLPTAKQKKIIKRALLPFACIGIVMFSLHLIPQRQKSEVINSKNPQSSVCSNIDINEENVLDTLSKPITLEKGSIESDKTTTMDQSEEQESIYDHIVVGSFSDYIDLEEGYTTLASALEEQEAISFNQQYVNEEAGTIISKFATIKDGQIIESTSGTMEEFMTENDLDPDQVAVLLGTSNGVQGWANLSDETIKQYQLKK